MIEITVDFDEVEQYGWDDRLVLHDESGERPDVYYRRVRRNDAEPRESGRRRHDIDGEG